MIPTKCKRLENLSEPGTLKVLQEEGQDRVEKIDCAVWRGYQMKFQEPEKKSSSKMKKKNKVASNETIDHSKQ